MLHAVCCACNVHVRMLLMYSSSLAHDLTYLPTQELLQWRQRRSMVKTDGQTLYDYQLNECAEWPTSLARLAAATGLAGC